MLDTSFLSKLHIMRIDSPNGFELMNPIRTRLPDSLEVINPESFIFCPGAEQDVSLRAVKKDPTFYLGGDLHWLRDRQAESACALPPDYEEPTTEDQQSVLQMIDTFIEGHDVQKLPDLDAADFPFHDEMLYWRKTANN